MEAHVALSLKDGSPQGGVQAVVVVRPWGPYLEL